MNTANVFDPAIPIDIRHDLHIQRARAVARIAADPRLSDFKTHVVKERMSKLRALLRPFVPSDPEMMRNAAVDLSLPMKMAFDVAIMAYRDPNGLFRASFPEACNIVGAKEVVLQVGQTAEMTKKIKLAVSPSLSWFSLDQNYGTTPRLLVKSKVLTFSKEEAEQYRI